jgi:MoxR-like ATPase
MERRMEHETTYGQYDSAAELCDSVNRLYAGCTELKEQIRNVIVGRDELIDSVLCCFLAGGHCITKAAPGLAKGLVAKSISQGAGLKFRRIQFTPDLTPSDITGAFIRREVVAGAEDTEAFLRGPIFANLILANELDQAPPKTQALLLHAMSQGEVVVTGRTYQLDEPFFVLATKNSDEDKPAFPLPHSALDRFMLMIDIAYPPANQEHAIAKRNVANCKAPIEPVLTREDVAAFQETVRGAVINDFVVGYCIRLVRATRVEDPYATEMGKNYLKCGAGPRAGQHMVLAAKARALMKGRPGPCFDDVRLVAKAVLRHRLILSAVAASDGVDVEQILDDLIQRVPIPK